MNIKEINARKKDPAGYLEKRAFEILRELERILSDIGPKVEEENKHIETFKQEKQEEIAEMVAIIEACKKQIHDIVDPKIAELNALVSDFAEKTTQSFTEKDASLQKQIENVFTEVTARIREIQLMRGPQGAPGTQGAPGVRGKDGSPDTGEQIAKKLNKTKGTVSMAVIAGLLEEIQALKREVRKKGDKGGTASGGMGNVQHETKQLTALSTTVSTNFPISGGGYAIMGAYYQSALIMRGEHYTVGGDRKTLTLLFTPEDNTKIDIIYVR